MALDSVKKKRTNLLNIVDRLFEKKEERNAAIVQQKKEETLLPFHRPAVPIRSYLLPPTTSSGPTSPSTSEESTNEEEPVTDKGSTVEDGTEEIKKDHCVQKQPHRCEVCGLRVYKSYRFVTRTSAPAHLKNFITPDSDRMRVCKRCFSSRERCRENLALVQLCSKTSQMIHIRTPLGVTYNRITKGIDYIARDLRKSLKRPYEDLLCDETMADEEEMEVDDERFLLNSDTTKDQDLAPKASAAENGNAKTGMGLLTPVQVKNVGIVTVVKRQNGKFSSVPNCFTIYGEVGNLKVTDVSSTDKVDERSKNGPDINVMENLKKLVDQGRALPLPVNDTTSSEINSINNKLTFLDHAYALPPPKGKASPVPKSQAVNRIKSPASKVVKNTNPTKQESPKKTVSPSGQNTSERTCGIVCFLCNNLVTKSYSCYKKENSPEKIKHLFTPGVKVVKVCRRCMPYKKPKEEDGATGTGKSKTKKMKGKLAKIKSAKLIKNAKSTGKGNVMKGSEKKSIEKNNTKSPAKDEKKRKNHSKDDNVSPAKKQCSVVVQTKKEAASKGTKPVQVALRNLVAPKDATRSDSVKSTNTKIVSSSTKVLAVPKGAVTKLLNTKPMQSTLRHLVAPKAATKSVCGKSTTPNIVSSNTKALTVTVKSSVQKNDNNVSEIDKAKNSTADQATAVLHKQISTRMDSDTQSTKSISRGKGTSEDSTAGNASVVNEEKVSSKSLAKECDVESDIKPTSSSDKHEKSNTETQTANSEERSKAKVSSVHVNEGVTSKSMGEDSDVRNASVKQDEVANEMELAASSDKLEKSSIETHTVDNEERSKGKTTSEHLNEELTSKVLARDGDANNVSMKQDKKTNEQELIMSNDKLVKSDNETQRGDSEQRSMEVVVTEPEQSEVVLLEEFEDGKKEVKNEEVSKETMEGHDESTTTESKNVTDSNSNTRERRSASKSPVRAREVKTVEVSSPRRGRSSGSPDKKRKDYKQITPTVMTRKRLASFSESEGEKRGDTNTGVVAGKRRAVVALLEKISRKSGDSLPAQNSSADRAKDESTSRVESVAEQEKGHSMTRRNQMPIKCPGCNEKVVKSYMCLTRSNAPSHLQPLFQQQSVMRNQMLRICRKCVNKKGT